MAVVTTRTTLGVAPRVVWAQLRQVQTLKEVARPLLVMTVPAGTPDRWQVGRTVPLTSELFGIVPLGTQEVTFTEIDDTAMRAATEESGGMVRRWDHVMTVEGPADGPAVLTDEVTIEAGAMTPLVAWFARRLYAHRHRRWTEITSRL